MTAATSEYGIATFPQRKFRRRVVVALSLAFVVAAAFASLFIVRGVDAQMTDIGRTWEVRRIARDLVQSLTDAETGQRGYLLTLDPAYLDPYNEAAGTIDAIYDALARATDANPESQRRIASLAEPIDRKRMEMAQTVNMAVSGRIEEAMAVLRSNAGLAFMDVIRTTLAEVVAEEDKRLLQRNADVATLRIWLVVMIMLALGSAVLLVYLLLMRSQRTVTSLSRNHSALKTLNVELESRVRERTGELEEARAHAERERARVEALLQDANHRIGNSLATVSSLLGLQLHRSRSTEVQRALEAAQNRVQAIASGHRRLRLGTDLETTNADEFLNAVIDDLQSTQTGTGSVTLQTQVEALTIYARDATTLGIIVGELVVNALKHAFVDDTGGYIQVSLSAAESGVLLAVEDNGRGMSDAAQRDSDGLGAMIITQLSQQFGGEVCYAPGPAGGTRVSVRLPQFDIVDMPDQGEGQSIGPQRDA